MLSKIHFFISTIVLTFSFSVSVLAGNPYEEQFSKMLPELTESFKPALSLYKQRDDKQQEATRKIIDSFGKAKNKSLNLNRGSFIIHFGRNSIQIIDKETLELNEAATAWIDQQPDIKQISDEISNLLRQAMHVENSWNRSFKNKWAAQYSWAIPSDKAIQTLKNYSQNTKGIVEVGAGNGYWAGLLQSEGVDILAYDDFSWGYQVNPEYKIEVQRADSEVSGEHPERMLLIVHPPQNDMAYKSLKAFRGQYVAYVGEISSRLFDLMRNKFDISSNSFRTMADDSFDFKLLSEFDLLESVEIPNWPGFKANLTLFKRKDLVSSSAQLLSQMTLDIQKRCFNPICRVKGSDTIYKKCGRCGNKTTLYCSKSCQVAHWPEHKKTCTLKKTETFKKL